MALVCAPRNSKSVVRWSKPPSNLVRFIRFHPPVEWHRLHASVIDPWCESRWQSLHRPKAKPVNTAVGVVPSMGLLG